MSSTNLIHKFWEEHPALLYALAILLGCAWAFEGHWAIGLPILLLWSPLFFVKKTPLRQRLTLAFCTFLFAAGYCTLHYRLPLLPAEGVVGVGELDISSVSSSRTHFGTYWIYKGALRSFIPQGHFAAAHARHIPVHLTLTDSGIFNALQLIVPTKSRDASLKTNIAPIVLFPIKRPPGILFKAAGVWPKNAFRPKMRSRVILFSRCPTCAAAPS